MSEMRAWITPETSVQCFEPNDSISVCMKLHCEVGTGGWGFGFDENGKLHREDQCGNSTVDSEVMREDGSNGSPITSIWLDGYKVDSANKSLIFDSSCSNGVIDDNDQQISADVFKGLTINFSGAVSIVAKWISSHWSGDYVHTGTATFNARRPNHS